MFIRFLFTLLLSASVPCAILLISYSNKRRSMPGAKYFILLLLMAIIYNVAYIGEINSRSLSWATLWYNIEHIAIPVQHYLWFMMSLDYVRIQKKYFQSVKFIMLYHPVLYILIFYTNNIHHLYISDFQFKSNGFFTVIISNKGPLFILMVLSGTILGIIATVFYIRGLIKSPRLHRNGYIVMIIASVFPWLTVYFNTTNTNFLGVDYFPVVSIISGVLYVYGIFKFKMFRTIPIATETVFRQSKEGILLVDLSDYIIDVNAAFLKIYPELKHFSKKHTFTGFIVAHPELSGINEENVKLQYPLMTEEGERYFAAEISKIVTEDDLEIGKIFAVNDVTIYFHNEKRLESIATNAINQAETNEISFLQAQIKPHFINNTLSVIESMISREPDEARNLIADLGEYLMSCYYFDSTSDMELVEKELEIVSTYVNIEKARFRERLHFQIVCDNIPQINIPRLTLQPLIENAILHGILKKAQGGNVWLKIRPEGSSVVFEITDDGVGMVEEQVSLLTKGDIQKQGIGILNIHKRLLKYYGEGLQISSHKGLGTTVMFSVPIIIRDQFNGRG